MERRQRISTGSKLIILSAAIFTDLLLWLFGWVAGIPFPPISLIGTAGVWLINFLWTTVLTIWLIGIGVGFKRLWRRLMLIITVQGAALLVSLFPFLGGLIAAGLVFINTLLLYFLIKAVEKEDKEYNELQERKEKEFGRAKTMKQYQELQKQFAEEEKLLAERSILNKKHA